MINQKSKKTRGGARYLLHMLVALIVFLGATTVRFDPSSVASDPVLGLAASNINPEGRTGENNGEVTFKPNPLVSKVPAVTSMVPSTPRIYSDDAKGPWHSIAPVIDKVGVPPWLQRYVDQHNQAMSTSRTVTTDTNHYLIYTCRKNGPTKAKGGCSGTGNRHRAIQAMFLVAMLTGRTFLIDSENPV
jgi:hypothetical protein